MLKRSKPNHPLVRLRKLLPAPLNTQKGLAKQIGLSASYLQKIELGERAFTADIAAKISAVTGVSATSLDSEGLPRDTWGKPYSEGSYTKFSQYLKKVPDEEFETLLKLVILHFEVLLIGARRCKQLRNVLLDINTFLERSRKESSLSGQCEKIMKQRTEVKLGIGYKALLPWGGLLNIEKTILVLPTSKKSRDDLSPKLYGSWLSPRSEEQKRGEEKDQKRLQNKLGGIARRFRRKLNESIPLSKKTLKMMEEFKPLGCRSTER